MDGPPTVPLKAGTDEGLLKLLFVPSAPPTLVPAKPATVDGLFRLELVPSTPPVAVPVKPGTVDGLLKLAFRVPVGVTTVPFATFVFNPAPVVVEAAGAVPAPLGMGATLEEMRGAGPSTAVEMIESAAVPAATAGELWASARIPESPSAAPRASVIGVRAKEARSISRKNAIDVPRSRAADRSLETPGLFP